MNTWNDEALLNHFAKGYEKAFVILMNRHSSSVKGYVLRMLRNEEHAEEICTETFFRIALQKGEWESKGYSFKSYLFRIAHNLAIDVIRKRTMHRKKEGEVIQFSQIIKQQSNPEEALQQKQREKMLQDALLQLDDEERELVLLRSTHGFSAKETATILNLSPTQVDARYAYARTKLKKVIGNLYQQKRKRS
jgi:RNA polymerase sigma-70 factor (ECF subfamily)